MLCARKQKQEANIYEKTAEQQDQQTAIRATMEPQVSLLRFPLDLLFA